MSSEAGTYLPFWRMEKASQRSLSRLVAPFLTGLPARTPGLRINLRRLRVSTERFRTISTDARDVDMLKFARITPYGEALLNFLGVDIAQVKDSSMSDLAYRDQITNASDVIRARHGRRDQVDLKWQHEAGSREQLLSILAIMQEAEIDPLSTPPLAITGDASFEDAICTYWDSKKKVATIEGEKYIGIAVTRDNTGKLLGLYAFTREQRLKPFLPTAIAIAFKELGNWLRDTAAQVLKKGKRSRLIFETLSYPPIKSADSIEELLGIDLLDQKPLGITQLGEAEKVQNVVGNLAENLEIRQIGDNAVGIISRSIEGSSSPARIHEILALDFVSELEIYEDKTDAIPVTNVILEVEGKFVDISNQFGTSRQPFYRVKSVEHILDPRSERFARRIAEASGLSSAGGLYHLTNVDQFSIEWEETDGLMVPIRRVAENIDVSIAFSNPLLTISDVLAFLHELGHSGVVANTTTLTDMEKERDGAIGFLFSLLAYDKTEAVIDIRLQQVLEKRIDESAKRWIEERLAWFNAIQIYRHMSRSGLSFASYHDFRRIISGTLLSHLVLSVTEDIVTEAPPETSTRKLLS